MTVIQQRKEKKIIIEVVSLYNETCLPHNMFFCHSFLIFCSGVLLYAFPFLYLIIIYIQEGYHEYKSMCLAFPT